MATDRKAAVEALAARDDEFRRRHQKAINRIAESDPDEETRAAAAKHAK